MIPPGVIAPVGLLAIVDWSWWANRAYHANGVDGMLPAMVGRLADLLRPPCPSHVVVAVDSIGVTWRHDAFPAYKSGREPKPQEFYQTTERALEIVSLYGVPVIDAEGFEADDVIAAVVDRARDDGLTTAIVSPDKDLLQLVDADVCSWDGWQKVRWPGDVRDDFGIAPEQVPDWLAITGDTVDAVPGVPGLGTVLAANILDAYGTVQAALDSPDPDPGIYAESIATHERALASLRRKKKVETEEHRELRVELSRWRAARNLAADLVRLQAYREQVMLSRLLATLRTDAPIAWSEEAARVGGGDREALARQFRSIGWVRLAAEVLGE